MRVLFATVAALKQGPAGPTSDFGSARYRVLIPAAELSRLGHAVQIASLDAAGGRWPEHVKQAPCDVVVISKSFHSENLALAASMRARGVRVVADICDDYFDDAEHGAHFRDLIAAADEVIAASEAMAESIRRNAGRDSRVVSDPVEGPRGAPRFAPGAPGLRVAWFGMPFNLHGIAAKKDDLRRLVERMPVHLAIVTAAAPEVSDFVKQLSEADPARLRVEFVRWSLEATWAALAACDVAWIPTDESRRAAVKSPNRLLEALWAGRWVVADAIPSYVPFADLVPIGPALDEGVTVALADPAGATARIAQAQERIARLHSPQACGEQWARALAEAAPQATRQRAGS